MNETLQFLVEHGYIVLFTWVLADQLGLPLPSTPVIVAAGALSHSGHLSFAGLSSSGAPLRSSQILSGSRSGDAVMRQVALKWQNVIAKRSTEDFQNITVAFLRLTTAFSGARGLWQNRYY